jgi:hypothetical protein
MMQGTHTTTASDSAHSSSRYRAINFIEDELGKYLQQQSQNDKDSKDSKDAGQLAIQQRAHAQGQAPTRTSQALVNYPQSKSDSQVAICTPLPPKKKKSSKLILSEENYVATLGKIIERDYFPDSDKLREQLLVLEQLEAKHRLRRFGDSSGSSTPLSRRTLNSNIEQEASHTGAHEVNDGSDSCVDIENLTVETFFHKFTSEDNESFEELHEKDKLEHQRMYHWMYESLVPSTNQLENGPSHLQAGMLMLYYVGNTVLTGEKRVKMDDILNHTNAHAQMFSSRIQDGDDGGFDTRANTGTSNPWRFQVRNNLLFEPTLDGSRYTHKLPQLDEDNEKRYHPTLGDSDKEKLLLLTAGPSDNISLLTNQEGALSVANSNSEAELVPSGSTLSMLPPTSTMRSVVRSLQDREKRIQRNNTSFREMENSATDVHMATPMQGISTRGVLREPPHTPSTAHDSDEEDDWDLSTEASTPRNGDQTQKKIYVTKFTRKHKKSEKQDSIRPAGDYSCVPMSPMISPDNVEMSPLMTYGTVLGKPIPLTPRNDPREARVRTSDMYADADRLLGGTLTNTPGFASTTGPNFEMVPMSSREILARNLETKYKNLSTPTVGTTKLTERDDGIFSSPNLRTPTSAHSALASVSNRGSKRKSVPMSPAATALAEKLNKRGFGTPSVW